MTQRSSQPFQSYFWLRAPLNEGDITFGKKKISSINDVFSNLALHGGQAVRYLSEPEAIISKEDRHLTIFEQPYRPSKTEPDVERRQPITTMDDLDLMLEVIQDAAVDSMPLQFEERSLRISEHKHQLSLVMNFNEKAKHQFDSFYYYLLSCLKHEFDDFYDVCDNGRTPHVRLAKRRLLNEVPRGDSAVQTSIDRFNSKGFKISTHFITFDRLVLGQGLYTFDETGRMNRLASRDVATIYFDGSPLDWHCDDPFDPYENGFLIDEAMQHREQDQVSAQQIPSLVS